jgi:hypothetical protein
MWLLLLWLLFPWLLLHAAAPVVANLLLPLMLLPRLLPMNDDAVAVNFFFCVCDPRGCCSHDWYSMAAASLG